MVFKVSQRSSVLKPSVTLGVVTSGPQVTVNRLGSENFVTSPVGNAFHIYDCSDLQLQYISRQMLGQVSCCASVGECTIISVSKTIFIFHKMTLLAQLDGHEGEVKLMTTLGDSFLVSCSGNEVLVWQLPTLNKQSQGNKSPLKPVRKLRVDFDVSSIVHPPTYLNKMLLGGPDGKLELWNINTGSKIYSFSSQPQADILVIAPSPALDVVGVGYADGTIVIMNLKDDEVLMTLNQNEHGAVTALSFRRDSVGGQLVSGSNRGDFVVWDLNKRSIHSFHRSFHPGGVGTLCFLDALPLIVSSGSLDNAISIHIFDKPDGGCRLLKERRGFTSELSYVMPYGDHDMLVSGTHSETGRCELGKINLIQSHQNNVWSQSALNSQTPGKNSLMPWKFRNLGGQLPAVASMSYCEDKIRHFDWPTVVTTHAGLPDAYVWSPHQQALITRMLIVPRKATTGQRPPNAVKTAVSTCGNYAVVGFENGELHRFNLQSCYHRGLVGTLSSPPRMTQFLSARDMITADKDSIRLWKVVPRPVEIAKLSCVCDIDQVAVHGFLAAVSHESKNIVSIIDIHADRKARTIPVSDKVTSMCWAHGGRWIAIASKDNKMIIYDLPTASVVDRIEFACTVIGSRWTPNNTSLITCHANGKGSIRVWQNLALLEGPGVLGSKFVSIDKGEQVSEGEKAVEENKDEDETSTVEGETGEFSLSAGSRTRWQQILKLDEIKERNKPRKAAEKPKEAPFFLPVRYQGIEPVFVAPETTNNEGLGTKESPVKKQKTDHESGYIGMVLSGDFKALREHLMAQTSSGVHICISELGDEEDALNQFLGFLSAETLASRNLDLVATWTALFLKQYGQILRSQRKFQDNLVRLETAAKEVYTRFETESNQLQCFLKVTAALQLHR